MFGYPSYAYAARAPRVVRQRPASLYDNDYPYGYYPQPAADPRTRYLNAVDEARAAREEYEAALAQEQLRRERELEREDALRAALARRGRTPYSSYPGLYPDDDDEDALGGADERDYYMRRREQAIARKRAQALAEAEAAAQAEQAARKKQDQIRAFEEELLNRQRQAAQLQAEQEKRKREASAQRNTLSPSLRAKLEGRLQGERDPEVRQAILNMLGSPAAPIPSPQRTTSPPAPHREASRSPAPAPAPVPEQITVAPAATTTTPAPAPTPTRKDHSPVRPPAHLTPLQKIAHIGESFTELTTAFALPATLDFQPATTASPAPSSSSIHPNLAFTPTNAPLHAHTHALNSLLDQLDAVDSEGDAEVRRERREMVRRVEAELERLEGMVRRMWEAQNGSEAGEKTIEEKEMEEKEMEVDTHRAEDAIDATTSHAIIAQDDASPQQQVADARVEDDTNMVSIVEPSPDAPSASESVTQTDADMIHIDERAPGMPAAAEAIAEADTHMVHGDEAVTPADAPEGTEAPIEATPAQPEPEDADMVHVEVNDTELLPEVTTESASVPSAEVHAEDAWVELDDSEPHPPATDSQVSANVNGTDVPDVELALATPLPADPDMRVDQATEVIPCC